MTVQVGPHEFDHIRYDARRDVLYLSVGKPQAAADSLVTPEGHVVRFDAQREVIGITIINAKWLTERNEVSISLPVFVQNLEPALA
jgi:uncharacterized protein YuzE